MKAREEQAQLLGLQEQKEAAELGMQMKSVLGSQELSQQYQYLVKNTQVMSMEQFLEAHAKEIAQSTPLPEAPSMDLAPLRVVAAAHRSQEFGAARSISEQDQAAIFKELPALSSLFSATVPSMMTEAQFWERCLKSRYFLNAAGNEVPLSHPEDRLFDSLPPPEAPTQPALEALASHPEADLTGEFQRDKAMEAKKANDNLIRRLNDRSAGILAAAKQAEKTSSDAVEDAGVAGRVLESLQQRRTQLKNAAETFREDLAASEPVKVPKTARLQLKPEAGRMPVLNSFPQKRPADTPVLTPHKALKAWRTTGSGCQISEPGTRWVLKSATEELLKAERLAAKMDHAEVTAPEPVQQAGQTNWLWLYMLDLVFDNPLT